MFLVWQRASERTNGERRTSEHNRRRQISAPTVLMDNNNNNNSRVCAAAAEVIVVLVLVPVPVAGVAVRRLCSQAQSQSISKFQFQIQFRLSRVCANMRLVLDSPGSGGTDSERPVRPSPSRLLGCSAAGRTRTERSNTTMQPPAAAARCEQRIELRADNGRGRSSSQLSQLQSESQLLPCPARQRTATAKVAKRWPNDFVRSPAPSSLLFPRLVRWLNRVQSVSRPPAQL